MTRDLSRTQRREFRETTRLFPRQHNYSTIAIEKRSRFGLVMEGIEMQLILHLILVKPAAYNYYRTYSIL